MWKNQEILLKYLKPFFLLKMSKILISLKNFLLDLLFPALCINCQKERSYLCPDCFSLIELAPHQYCPFCNFPRIVPDGKTCLTCRKQGKKLTGLFSAVPYTNFLVKKLISQFKYQPYVKDLAKTLTSLIIHHFQLLDKKPEFLQDNFWANPQSDFILVPVPLHKKKLKQRGFNQAQEIAKELSNFSKISLFNDVLLKIKETLPQVELSGKEREENIKGVFVIQNPEKVKDKKILLVDDVFTTGSTMEECARVLKMADAREIWGIVVARG